MSNVKDWLIQVKKTERVLSLLSSNNVNDQDVSDEFLTKVSDLHYRITDVFNYFGPDFNYDKHIEILKIVCFYFKLNSQYGTNVKICYNPETEHTHFKILQNYLWHFPQFESLVCQSSCKNKFKNHMLYMFFVDKNKHIVDNDYNFKNLKLNEVIDINVFAPSVVK